MSKATTGGADYTSFNPARITPREAGRTNITIGNTVLTRSQMLQQILAALDTKDKEEHGGSDYQDNPNDENQKFNPITGNMSSEKRADASETIYVFFPFESV